MLILIGYIIVINIIAFSMYGIDKKRAENHQWRISEFSLLMMSLIGGGIGSYLGMKHFHHKTRKPKFKIGVPVLTIISILVIYQIYILLPTILNT